jgi:Domain of Unknown Function (DUF1080)
MKKIFLNILFLLPFAVLSQSISMTDMSFWKNSGKNNWALASAASADMNTKESMVQTPGTGVLVNLPTSENHANLESIMEHGDADISFDFMMASHSNSGFYLQGRYEVQLLDSWGVKNPNSGDCGGIYKRRRFIRGADGKMQEYLWEGHAPRVNTCLAPGLWQHMEISFQAPKFDLTGNKIKNAKVLLIKMNGVVIQENVELTGPTGGPISEKEVALGPVMIQGDHGPVAFKNMSIKNLAGTPAELTNIEYQTFYGAFKEPKDFFTKKPNETGKLEKLTWEVSKQPNDFAMIYKANFVAPIAGKYQFTLQNAGRYYAKIGDKVLLPDAWTFTNDKRVAEIELPAGNNPFEITTYKTDGWMNPILAMWVAGPNFRNTPFHSIGSVLAGAPNDPILLNAKTPTILRSFADLYNDGKKIKRITHAVNVGHPDKLNYTYNLDNGALDQIWKGDFLDTSPMWDDRGDGSSRPRGVVLPLPDLGTIVSPNALKFKTLGYDLDENDLPTFRYQINGTEVNDKIRITDNKFFTRTISLKNNTENTPFSCRIAEGNTISKVSANTYLIDGAYFVKAENAEIKTLDGKLTLLKLIDKEISYAILW